MAYHSLRNLATPVEGHCGPTGILCAVELAKRSKVNPTTHSSAPNPNPPPQKKTIGFVRMHLSFSRVMFLHRAHKLDVFFHKLAVSIPQ